MGLLPCLEPRHCLAAPDTPPGLVSPASSSYSSRPSPSEELGWNSTAPVSPPMSDYDQKDMSSVGKSLEEGPSRNDIGAQLASRGEKLPSINDILGPPTSLRPLHSPLSDRPNSYAATSPLDRHRGSSAHGERQIPPSSHYSRTISPTVNQPRGPYEGRYEPERPQNYPLTRSVSGPGSPAVRDPDTFRQDSRSEQGYGGNWPYHRESGTSEYAMGSREPPMRSPHDRLLPLQLPPNRTYPGPRPLPGPSPGPPPTPTSSGEVLSKDGLGPKIWTGTQFLPRFVKAAEVQGEGMCYFYDDGSHCKTVIDGEAVNAHWGVTKAGKPRKRLAIACVTCREKKIKCDPDYPRCVQCEKFGRVCRFKNAPRGGHNTSPSTPPAEVEEHRRIALPPQHHDLRRPGSNSSASVSPQTAMHQASPEPHPHKRLRLGYDGLPPRPGEPSPVTHTPDTAKPNLSWHQQVVELPRIHEDMLSRVWQTDPYVSEPQSISTVVSSFFVHIDSTMVLNFLPDKAFKFWLASQAHQKSPEDLMLVYSILAVGLALSDGPKNIASEYAQVGHFAQQRTRPCLQLVQSRILLAIYYSSTSRPAQSDEMSTLAISTAAFLDLNLELEQSKDAALAVFPYNLTRTGFAESRRRTFWSCFAMERLNGQFPKRVAILNPEDIFIRLPSGVQSFEEQTDESMPVFDPWDFRTLKGFQQHVGVLGRLMQMVHMWGEGMTSIYRSAYRRANHDSDFPKLLQERIARLDEWQASLPRHLTCSTENMNMAAADGNTGLGPFITMHLLYQHAKIKLLRHVHLTDLASATTRLQYVARIQDHASSILGMTRDLDIFLKGCQAPLLSARPPMMSAVVLEAVDVLTAEGALTELPYLIDQLKIAKAVIYAMGSVWEESGPLRLALDHRIEQLAQVLERRPDSPIPISISGCRVFHNRDERLDKRLTPGLCWQFSERLETMFPEDMDLVYSTLTPIPHCG